MSRSNWRTPCDLLTGRAENVSIQGSSGNVGGGSRIRIRGITSLTQDNNPLLIIDGVPNNSSNVGINRGQTFSRFNDLDPSNIESIQIVKGPSATALYGSEAAPGVIIVQTKSGSRREGFSVNFQSEVGARQSVTDYPANYADVTSEFGITDPGDSRLDGWPTAQNAVTGQVFVLDNPFEDASTSPFRTGYSINKEQSDRRAAPYALSGRPAHGRSPPLSRCLRRPTAGGPIPDRGVCRH